MVLHDLADTVRYVKQGVRGGFIIDKAMTYSHLGCLLINLPLFLVQPKLFTVFPSSGRFLSYRRLFVYSDDPHVSHF